MGLTNKEIQKLMEDCLLELKKAILRTAKEELAEQLRWTLRNETAKIVTDFFIAEIKPDLEAGLKENKAEILKHLLAAMAQIASDLEEKLVMLAKERIGKIDSYGMGEILKGIF